jgi:glucan phosphoethanolaminetransferase (alkaline phosphatase superfamily)
MRVLRGTLAASLATFVAAFSHVLGGGALPSAAAVSLSFSLALLVCIALAGRRLSLWRTVASVAFSQLLFHALFSTVMGTSSITMSAHAGHGVSDVVITSSSGAGASGHPSTMWFAHAGAAALTVVAIRYAEVALAALHASTGLFRGIFASIQAVHVSRDDSVPRVGCSQRVVARDLSVLFSALRHRGPPALASA